MIDNFLPLPEGQLGTIMLQEAPCIRVCYRGNEPGGLDYEIHPREFSMNDLLGQLAHAVDCLIATTPAETLLARLDECVALDAGVFNNCIAAKPMHGVVIAATLLAAQDLGALAFDADNCLCIECAADPKRAN